MVPGDAAESGDRAGEDTGMANGGKSGEVVDHQVISALRGLRDIQTKFWRKSIEQKHPKCVIFAPVSTLIIS
jgi:hypothetical protein